MNLNWFNISSVTDDQFDTARHRIKRKRTTISGDSITTETEEIDAEYNHEHVQNHLVSNKHNAENNNIDNDDDKVNQFLGSDDDENDV